MSDPAQKEKERVIGIFDRAAATYDRVGPRVFSHFGQRLVDVAPLAPGLHVLDIAAGRGAVLFPAAQRVGGGGRVVGIDLSADMVRETAAEIRRAGLRHVEMRQMDAEHLEFPDATFDCVLCGFALWFFPDSAAALHEIRRVLKPGGSLTLTTWAEDNPAQRFSRGVLRPFLSPGASGATRQNVPQFNSTEQIHAGLSLAGFKDIREFAEAQNFVYGSGEDWWATLWSMGARGNLEKFTPEVLDQAKRAGLKAVEAYRKSDGIHIVHRALFGFGVKPGR